MRRSKDPRGKPSLQELLGLGYAPIAVPEKKREVEDTPTREMSLAHLNGYSVGMRGEMPTCLLKATPRRHGWGQKTDSRVGNTSAKPGSRS